MLQMQEQTRQTTKVCSLSQILSHAVLGTTITKESSLSLVMSCVQESESEIQISNQEEEEGRSGSGETIDF